MGGCQLIAYVKQQESEKVALLEQKLLPRPKKSGNDFKESKLSNFKIEKGP